MVVPSVGWGKSGKREEHVFREVEIILVLDWLDWRGLNDGDTEKAIISEIVGSYWLGSLPDLPW